MRPVIQEEKTGCGIASAAVIASMSYQQAKDIANQHGISASKEALYTTTQPVRRLLDKLGFDTGEQIEFADWDDLPKCALLATKWHERNGKAYWHWSVFYRSEGQNIVFDSSTALVSPIRTDFENIEPKWFIKVTKK